MIGKGDRVLEEGDWIEGVGSENWLNSVGVMLGEGEEGEVGLRDRERIECLLVRKKEMIKKELGEVKVEKKFGCRVSGVGGRGIELCG